MSKPWTEAHRREALRRTYEIAAERAADGDDVGADLFAFKAGHFVVSEDEWRRAFVISGLDAARIDREVRRVRALAEGRLVRETSERWEVWQGGRRCSFVPEGTALGGVEQVAAAMWASERNKMLDKVGSKGPRYRAVCLRVTRIRRAR